MGIICQSLWTTSRKGPHVPIQARFLAMTYLCQSTEPDSPSYIILQRFVKRAHRELNFLVCESSRGNSIHATVGRY